MLCNQVFISIGVVRACFGCTNDLRLLLASVVLFGFSMNICDCGFSYACLILFVRIGSQRLTDMPM